MAHYTVRSAPFHNRPWSIKGQDADEGIAVEHGSYSNRKSLDSLEKSRRIKKRQEEWKQVLNSGNEKEPQAAAASLRQASLSQPSLRDRKHLLVNDRRVSCSDIKKTAETLSLRDLRNRRGRGELVQAAKKDVNAETKNLHELREHQRLQRQRELDARKKAEHSHRLSKLEQEMSSLVLPKMTVEPPPKPPSLAVLKHQPAPKRRLKPKKAKERSTETDWFDSLLIKLFSVSCCAGREVVPDPLGSSKSGNG